MNKTQIPIHPQVQLQLQYLKDWVDGEAREKQLCEKWDIPYSRSRTADENEYEYEMYRREIENNGDKNLLVYVKVKTDYGHDIVPYARRYITSDYKRGLLVHRFDRSNASEPLVKDLVKEDDVEIIKNPYY